MPIDYKRSITFTIPGTYYSPAVKVSATENNGALDFTVNVLSTSRLTADLRGLFFNFNDDSKLIGLAGLGNKITGFDTNNVIDLGKGVNMQGAASPFDVGLRFGNAGIGKDDIQSTSFTLSNADNNLTLDDIANVKFGARLTSIGMPVGSRYDTSEWHHQTHVTRNGSAKLTVTAPAAPDAKDDAYSIFEDGQANLVSPSHIPLGTVFQVLDNDTDADGDTLTITDVQGVLHGTVQIVDGDDADILAGDAILYTPDADYSGDDSFEYSISDNNGGTDFARVDVTIEAVADIPDLDVVVESGLNVNEIILHVTTSETDADHSEYIDRILTNPLPAGVTLTPISVNPDGQLGSIAQDYLLTLAPNMDYDFDLTFTSVSKEMSNGDEETASKTIDIVYEYNSTTTAFEFTAQDQSIWGSGNQFTFVDDRFLGLDTGHFDETFGSVLYAGVQGDIQLGFQSTLTFEGGNIDATSNYDVTIETNYNKTVDQLLIDTSSLFTGASFYTEGPNGSYVLDFLYDVYLQAYAGVNVDFGSIDFDPLGIIPGDQTLDLGGINEQLDFPAVNIGPDSLNVLELDSDTLAGTIEFPPPLDAFSVNYDWPDITTSGASASNLVVASGSSNNFLELNIDVDELVSQLLELPVNPLHPVQLEAGPFYADVDLVDVDVQGGLNFFQDFEMQMGDELSGILLFEDGSNQSFTIGDSWLISNASLIDNGGNHNGFVDFAFGVVPTATLSNETDLGFNIGASVSVFSVALGYDIEIYNPFGDNLHYDDSIEFGPLAGISGTLPVGDIPVYENTFALNFSQEQYWFSA